MDEAAEAGGAVVLFAHAEIAADVPFFYEGVAVGKDQERIISELHAGVKTCGVVEWASVANEQVLTITRCCKSGFRVLLDHHDGDSRQLVLIEAHQEQQVL